MANDAVWKGLIAGLAGGLVASFVMGPVHEWANDGKKPSARQGEDATVQAAESLSEGATDHSLTRSEKNVAGPAIHFAFGGALGALYGAASELRPEVATGFGLPFGAAVYLGAHATAVPAVGWSKPLTESSLQAETAELASHLIYGAVTELVRAGLRKALD